MSYCRWSRDGSDLYCYEDASGGWTTHVRTTALNGERYNDPTLEAFRETVVKLMARGFHAPPYLLEQIDEEIANGPEGTD